MLNLQSLKTLWALILIACAINICHGVANADGAAADPYLWLEGWKTPASITWSKKQNSHSVPLLQSDKHYNEIEPEIRAIALAKDRIPAPALRNEKIYNFWQDSAHPKGLWRRTTLSQYRKSAPHWETVLDIDALSKNEKEPWVWRAATCLPPQNTKCIIELSKSGTDASVFREFDLIKKIFVSNGFVIPEAKSTFSWVDDNTLIVGSNFGPGSLTTSGYPRELKLWKRGQALKDAPTIFEGQETDVSVDPMVVINSEGRAIFITRSPSFFDSEKFLLGNNGKLQKIPIPLDSSLIGISKGFVLFSLRSDWTAGAKKFTSGSLLSFPLITLVKPDDLPNTLEVVYAPDDVSTLEGTSFGKDAIYLDTLRNVKGQILRITRNPSGWNQTALDLPKGGIANVVSADPFATDLIVSYESFLQPTEIFLQSTDGKPQRLKSLPPQFDASNLTVEQFESVSLDGTHIPYFLIHKKNIKLDGTNPTILYGYGGFEISMTPSYLGDLGKVWLERGGVYALSNIRGGGEFGPRWHEAAIKENRQRAYDDFYSVAKDLIDRGVTSQRRLGIMGGSNGGLLMGVAFTQHPELYSAVVCQVPLLDMLRYTKLFAGASWIGEYGDPAIPTAFNYISKYSPYQNVKSGVKYPSVFFITSISDDRVGPVHARKMAAKMEDEGNNVLYYENLDEGGHSGNDNPEEKITNHSLQYTYLIRQLMD